MATLLLQDIGLPAAQLRAVTRKARVAGKTAPEYVRLLIEQDLLADQSFDEILRPIRQDIRKSGVTQHQLEVIVRRARRAAAPPAALAPSRSPRR